MMEKNPLPFALSAATLLVACLIATNNRACAAEAEEPAVLQFATTYAEHIKPATSSKHSSPHPARQEVSVKPSRPPVVNPPVAYADRNRLTTLQNIIAGQELKIAQKNKDISQLEKQIAALQQSVTTLKQPVEADDAPHFNPADKQAMLDMVGDLRKLFSLTPGDKALVEKLTQLKKQQSDAQLEITALRNQLKTVSLSKDNDAGAREAELQQQIEQYQQQIATLKDDLSARGQDVAKVTAEKETIQAEVQRLTEKNTREQQKFADDKKALEALNQKLNDAQGQITALHNQLSKAGDDKHSDASVNEAALQQQVEDYRRKAEELEGRLSARSKDVDTITAEKTAIQTELQTLTEKNAREQQTFAEGKTQLQALNEKLNNAQLEVTSLREQLKTASKSKENDAGRREAELQQQVTQYQQQITKLEDHLSAQGKDFENLTTERNNIKTELQAMTEKQSRSQQVLAEETPQIQELKAKLLEAQQSKSRLETDKAKLESQLTARPTPEQLAESQLMVKSLQSKLDQTQLYGASKPDTPAANDNNQQVDTRRINDEKLAALQAKLDDALAKLAASEKQQKEVKPGNSLPALTPEKLNKKESREAYAIGMSLGDEILQMQAENLNWGTSNDQTIVLAGIVDAFQGQAKLSTDILRKTLKEVSQRVEKDHEKRTTRLDKTTKEYLQRFTKMKGTQKSPTGFWYHIDYIGDSPLPKNGTLDVVVKESLTNGDVITDMDAKGTVLTQPLADYPPVFKEALSKLRNHGSITIVVPPELAYKDKGMPPKIPPNATMVYTLRISESYSDKDTVNPH